ncbi:hypothetical protein BUALT_Bualt05G0094200 [Buddleja alternifolia]|uniref:LysM domain-containing protein n=1 Tax=Buddleja alternifolia TaxID=168488 RepID=A0AAV6XU19_9LAMI|nr:hypothetical protein BUALT_Bualt05G0094200 [Buddleja alternifolia]
MERESFLWMNDYGEGDFLRTGMAGSPSPPRSLPISSPPSSAVGVGVIGGTNYILHTVSKFDTLAGVAIKYGVEVADIKRLNGLVTDLQMFALKTLQIPLPGRHPPSPSLSNGHDTPQRYFCFHSHLWGGVEGQRRGLLIHGSLRLSDLMRLLIRPSSSRKTPITRRHSDLFDSFQSLESSSERKISPAMSTLQGFYGLKSADQTAHYLEDGPFTKSSSIPNPRLRQYRKSKSISNSLVSQEVEISDSDSSSNHTPEKLLKEENSSGSAISAITGKGLALRPKSASRNVSGGIESDLADSFVMDGVNGVRKSSSTSSLQDSDNGMLLSIWPTSKWSLKPDFQALSTAAITRPIFDGLPKPMSRRNKAALD